MRWLFFLIAASGSLSLKAQIDSSKYRDESIAFWQHEDEFYLSKETSPLTKKERKAFTGHAHYDFDINYVVKAHFQRTNSTDTIVMQTSAGTEKKYFRYAQLHFNIGHKHCHLYAYQSLALLESEEYKNYLFIPFKDATSGVETYGGGRYLDVEIPTGSDLILNFNKAYNPYCAYTTGYYCPIPPQENTLSIPIHAGAKSPVEHTEKKH